MDILKIRVDEDVCLSVAASRPSIHPFLVPREESHRPPQPSDKGASSAAESIET